MRLLVAAATLAISLLPVPLTGTAMAAELVMFESAACPYCRQWHEEIGGIYGKTPEGRAAPLRRVDIHAPPPGDLGETARGIVYTPTFVLLDAGREVGRIQGYPGEHFFWPLLQNLLADAGLATQ